MIIKSCVSIVLILLFLEFSSCDSFVPDYGKEYDDSVYDEYFSINPETVMYVEDALDLDLKDAEVEFDYNEHGFFGDGENITILAFYHMDSIENQLKENLEWDSFPLPKNLKTVLYGNENFVAHFTKGETDKPVLPEITNGYWYFYDRHPDCTYPKDTSKFLSRSSCNYTVAVYDSDEDTLYYFELDT